MMLARTGVCLLLLLLLAGCGQKGDLYLPSDEPETETSDE